MHTVQLKIWTTWLLTLVILLMAVKTIVEWTRHLWIAMTKEEKSTTVPQILLVRSVRAIEYTELLQTGKTPSTNEYPVYDFKPFDGEAPVLEFGGMWTNCLEIIIVRVDLEVSLIAITPRSTRTIIICKRLYGLNWLIIIILSKQL